MLTINAMNTPTEAVRVQPGPVTHTITPTALDALRIAEEAARLAGERLLNDRLAERVRIRQDRELAWAA